MTSCNFRFCTGTLLPSHAPRTLQDFEINAGGKHATNPAQPSTNEKTEPNTAPKPHTAPKRSPKPKRSLKSLNANHLGKCSPNLNIFISMFRCLCNNHTNTLSNQSKPRNAWGTYAPKRAPIHITKSLKLHSKHLLNPTPLVYQLLNPLTNLKQKPQAYIIIAHSTYFCWHLRS